MSTNDTPLPPPGNGTDLSPPTFEPSLFTEIPISERMAYLSRIYISVTATLLLFCTLTILTRVYKRVGPVWKVGWDDYFIIIGYCLSVVDWAFLLIQAQPQRGVISVDAEVHAVRYGWIAIGIWGISMTCIKVSIALTLLRIQGGSLPWRVFLFSIIGIQAAYGILNLFFNLLIACRPLAMAWDPRVTSGSCVSVDVMRAVSNTGSGVNIMTDALLSLAPALFLCKVNLPIRERIFICFLMGLGLFASASSIMKTVMVEKFYSPTVSPDDFLPIGISISTYTILEQFTGILAACIPALKDILQACLGRIGVSLSDSCCRQAHSGYHLSGRSAGGTTGHAASPSRTTGDSSDERYFKGGVVTIVHDV